MDKLKVLLAPFDLPIEVLTVIFNNIRDTNGKFADRIANIGAVLQPHNIFGCVIVEAWSSTWRFSRGDIEVNVTLADLN